jgi:hypothetical protein
MPEFCTCGAQLPPDAVFCHKCGKPQRDIVIPDAPPAQVFSPAPPPPPPLAEAPSPRLGFHDRVAVRIALYVGGAAGILGLFFPVVTWLAAGFFAVSLYRRKTGRLLDVNAGVHLGWITGLVMFPLTGLAYALDTTSADSGTRLMEQMNRWPFQDPATQRQMVQVIQSGPGIAAALGFMFLLVIGFSIAGGALGAKVSRRQ